MKRLFLASALLLAAPAVAADKAVSMLTPAELDPVRVLPPPPAYGSAQAKAELAELHAVETVRTPVEEADARADGDTRNATIFVGVLGPRFDLARLPATAHLLAIVRATEKDAVDRGKDEFKRPRPYAIDDTLKSCKRNEDPLSSYPSGHTSMAFSMAETLARLLPGKADLLLARAARYGQSRIVCGQHFRSDVTAGAILGAIVVERLMAKAIFRDAMKSASGELANAGLN